MKMKMIALDELDAKLRSRVLAAVTEPVLITEDDHPVLVIRSLLDDETADELIAQHPAFQESIERARQQRAEGKARTLAELRQKYSVETESTE
jgi:PHD/YefM family antitoxin component YafN of YafNO toxin-antitoxin module